MKKFALSFAAIALLATTANAAMVEVTSTTTAIPQEAIDAGAPAGWIVDVFATTDADILSIGEVSIDLGGTGEVFQVDPPFGSDDTAPSQAFIDLNKALLADTFITTPGDTSLLGAALPGDGSTTTFGDLSNDGAQNNFQFARIAVPTGTFGFFTGVVTVAGATAPENFAFSVLVPEPASLMLASFGLIGLASMRRRS